MRRGQVSDVPAIQAAYEELRSDYSAAKSGRFRRRLTGVAATGSGADYHVRLESQFLAMIERARAFDRDDPVFGQGVRRLITNVVQDGLRLDTQTSNKQLNAELTRRWAGWARDPENCHKSGELTWRQIERLVLRAVIIDGDILALPLAEGSLELVEAHRLRKPTNTQRNVVRGILLDEHRRHLEYWITKDDINPMRPLNRVSQIRKYPARDGRGLRQVLHIYNPTRVSQTRGITACAPIVDMIGMHDDLQFANLVRSQIASCIAFIREFDADASPPGPAGQTGERETETLADGSTRTIDDISPGMEFIGRAGEHITGWSPNVPNPEFFPHAMMLLTFIAINLDLPVQVLLLDPKQTNFSGWRGAMDQARSGFVRTREWLIDALHAPVFRWKLRQWLTDDPTLRAMAVALDPDAGADPLAWPTDHPAFAHRWKARGWPYIEPLKDAKADEMRVKTRLISPRRQQEERGLEWEDTAAEIVADMALLIETALREAVRINKQHPDAAVDWRELANMDPRGRKPAANSRAMEDVARAVRSGVRVAESEARVALGLPAEPPEGDNLLRFNEPDILGYHIENAQVTRRQVKERLNLPADDGDEVYIKRAGFEIVPADEATATATREGDQEAEEDDEPEEDRDEQ